LIFWLLLLGVYLGASRWKTLLAGPSPICSMKAEITIPYFQHTAAAAVVVVVVVVDSLAVLSIICIYIIYTPTAYLPTYLPPRYRIQPSTCQATEPQGTVCIMINAVPYLSGTERVHSTPPPIPFGYLKACYGRSAAPRRDSFTKLVECVAELYSLINSSYDCTLLVNNLPLQTRSTFPP
jgi:hypothetical protein